MARIRTLRSDSLAVQRDEIDSMAAIFADDFIRLSPDRDDDDDDDDDDDESAPISYAIRLVVSNLSSSSSFLSNDNGNAVPATTGTVVKATAHGSPPIAIDYELALGITYPPDYPAHSMPIFHLHYENNDNNNNNKKKKNQLHSLQEEAILQCAINSAASSSSSNHHPHYPNNNDDGEDEEEVEGIPCAYDCVLAVQEFIQNGGLDQAGLFILSSGGGGGDDVLAHILSYVLSSKEDIATVCTSLPLIFPIDGNVVKSNVLWKKLCERHWRTKWGFHNRWKKYVDAFRLLMQQSSSSSSSSSTTTTKASSSTRATKNNHNINHGQYFWMQAYHYEEADASRTHMTQHELHSMTFDYRTWFSVSSLRNQPENMRDVLPTGLKTTIAKDVVFSKNVPAVVVAVAGTTTSAAAATTSSSSSIPGGLIMTNTSELLSHLVWEGLTNNDVTKHRTKRIDDIHDDYDDDDDANDNGAIMGIDLKPLNSNSSSSVIDSLVVVRLPNWGWELCGANFIFRALDDDNNKGEEEDNEQRLWGDLITKMIIQERPGWITTNYRTRWETNYREIPDDEDCKMLHW